MKGKGGKGAKGAKTKVKEVNMTDKTNKRLGEKSCYIRGDFNSLYLDSNNVGDVYFEMSVVNKWEFIATDLPGGYFIRYIPTQLYLTSNEKGELFTTIELNSTFQKWQLFETSKPEVYAYQNLSNSLYLCVNESDTIYLDTKCTNGFLYTFQFFPKK